MEKKVKVKLVAKYAGHSVKANGNVDIGLTCRYDELVNYIQLVQCLNVDTTITVKLPDEKPMKLGSFRVREVKIDHDGEGGLKFNSMSDYVDIDNLNKLVGTEFFTVMFTADVEVEEEEEEDDSE
jgi:hypothetical protein